MPLLKSWFSNVNNPPKYMSTLPLPNEMEVWKLVAMTFTPCPEFFPFCFYSFLVLFMYFLFFFFFNFTMLYWFFHTSTWIHHMCTSVPHPEPPSILPPYTCLISFCFSLTFHFSPPFSVVLLIYSKIPTAHRINSMILNIGLNHPGTWSWFPFSTLSCVYHSLVLLSKFSSLCPRLTLAYTSIFPQNSLEPCGLFTPTQHR